MCFLVQILLFSMNWFQILHFSAFQAMEEVCGAVSILLILPHNFKFKYSHCAVQAMEAVEVVATMTVEAATVEEEAVDMEVAVEDTAEVEVTMTEVEDAEVVTVARVEVVVRQKMQTASLVDSDLSCCASIFRIRRQQWV